MAETVLRGEAIAYAANRTVADAAQELRERVAKTQAAGQTATAPPTAGDEASDKAALITALNQSPFFSVYRLADYSIAVWEKRGDVRVYIQQQFVSMPWKFTYFHTGNAWNCRGTMHSENPTDPLVAQQLVPLCQAICERHQAGFKCYSNDIKKASPDPQALTFYRQALNKVPTTI